jgi:DnaJ-class molecular chaperone
MDYYQVLGVPKKATAEEIKKQYRKMSLETHPDRPTGDNEKFKRVNEAYETLGDPQLRKQYDQPCNPEQMLMDMLFRHCPPVDLSGGGASHIFFEPMHFEEPPETLVLQVSISLEQSYTGCTLPVEIVRKVAGRGEETEVCYVDLPQGVDQNEFIVLEKKGHVSRGGARGNVQLVISLLPLAHLSRKGLDLLYTCNISLVEALCGFTTEITLFCGKKIKLSNSGGDSIIQPNSQKIVPQKGFVRDGRQGALIIKFDIAFPETLTADQKNALKGIL